MTSQDVKCYFNIKIGNHDVGRIVFKLFYKDCPRTCENFIFLCTGQKGIGQRCGKPLHYKGSIIHKVVKNSFIQGGDIELANGHGGESIYGDFFDDENLNLCHDEPYLLSMANRGPNSNSSQFIITTNEAPSLDGKNVIFGRLVSGLDTILKIERIETNSKNQPIKRIEIVDCGLIEEEKSKLSSSSHTALHKDSIKTEESSSRRGLRKRHRSSHRGDSRSSSNSSLSRYQSKATRWKTESHSKSSYSCTPSSSNTCRSYRSESCSSTSCTSSDCESSSSSSSSGSSSGSSSSSSSSSCSSSESNKSDDNSSKRQRKRQKTNRRLDVNKKTDHQNAPDAMIIDEKIDLDVNPNYKCSVNTNEIPEIPVNRFLMRDFTSKRFDKEIIRNEDEPIKVEADLSRFIDLPEEQIFDSQPSICEQRQLSVIKSQIKKTEPTVSKSGRIMKGRGSFKFRTPSPETSKPFDERRRYQGPPNNLKRRDSYNTTSLSWRNSRSRSRSPSRKKASNFLRR